MSEVFKVTELFLSFEGEGLRTGELAFFIRLFGCNLDCDYCDTRYSHKEGGAYSEMTAAELVARAIETGCKNVTVTGGEPLIHDHLNSLISRLLKAGLRVNIETNGSIDIGKIRRHKNLFFTCDYKCPCSGMTEKMHLDNLKKLRKTDCLKFVVGEQADLNRAKEIIESYRPKCYIYLSPVFGKIQPQEIAEFMKTHKLFSRVRLQLQLHKYVYPPEMRGV